MLLNKTCATVINQAIEAGEEPEQDTGNENGKNQFNYSERAAQTFNNPMRERGVVTEPPPMLSFKNTVAQWEIYDSYMIEYSTQVRGCSSVECGLNMTFGVPTFYVPAYGWASQNESMHQCLVVVSG